MSNQITCIITDDEPYARKGLKGYVDKTDFLTLTGMCENALALGNLLKQQKVDLLFLDIQMPYLNGVDFLRSLDSPPKVIFTTAFEQYAVQGFELDVLDYLVKPISYERFLKSAYKSLDYFSNRNNPLETVNSIFIKVDGRLEKLVFDDILYIEGMENYISIYTIRKRMVIHSTLKAFIEKLPADKFIQTHKSFVVAMDKISTVDGGTLLIGSNEIPLSRSMKENVMRQILK